MPTPLELVHHALDLRLQGNLDGAIALLAEGLDVADPQEHRQEIAILAHDLAITCEVAGRPKIAIEYVTKGLAACPDDLGLLYTLARLLIVAGRLPEARLAVATFSNACLSSTDELRAHWAELHSGLKRVLMETK